jgi:hypothetical protein
MSHIVPPTATCRGCGAKAPAWLMRCKHCGKRRWWPFKPGHPGARY